MEMLVALSTFVLVLLCIYQVYEVSLATTSRGEVKTDIQQGARFALGLMERELRMAGYGVASLPCPGTLPVIVDARRRSITFRADLRHVRNALTSAANAGTNPLTENTSTGFAASDVIYVTDRTICAPQTVQSVASGTLTWTELTPYPPATSPSGGARAAPKPRRDRAAGRGGRHRRVRLDRLCLRSPLRL